MEKLTPTQQRIYDYLSDGLPHPRKELQTCLADELSSLSALRFHLSLLRKKIAHKGEDVICEIRAYRISYRLVKLLPVAAKLALEGNRQ